MLTSNAFLMRSAISGEKRGVSVEQRGKRAPSDTENLGGPGDVETQLLDDLRADEVAWMRRRHVHRDADGGHQW